MAGKDDLIVKLIAELDVDSSIAGLQKQIDALSDSLRDHPIKLHVDTEALKNALQEATTTQQKITKVFSGKLKLPKIEGLDYDQLKDVANNIKGSVDSISKVQINTSKNGKITTALIEYKDELGRILRQTLQWKNVTDKATGAVKRVFDTLKLSYTDNRDEQRRKALLDGVNALKEQYRIQGLLNSAEGKYKEQLTAEKTEIDALVAKTKQRIDPKDLEKYKKAGEVFGNRNKETQALKTDADLTAQRNKNLVEAVSALKEQYRIQGLLINAEGKYKEQLQAEEKVINTLVNETKKRLDPLDQEKYDKADTVFKNRNLQTQALKDDNDLLTRQTNIYNNLTEAYRKYFEFKNKSLTADKETAKLYDSLSSMYEGRAKKIEEVIKDKNLTNDEKEYELQKLIGKMIQENSELESKSNIVKQQAVDKLEEEIKLYQQRAEITLRNNQSNYGKTMELPEFSKAIADWKQKVKDLDVKNLDPFAFRKLDTELNDIMSRVRGKAQLLRRDAMTFGEMWTQAIKKFGIWMGATTVVYQSFRFFSEGIKYVMDLNKALTEISVVTTKTQDEMKGLGLEYLNLARSMAVTTREIAEASVEFYRQGLSQSQVMDRVRVATQYAKISNLAFTESAQILTSTVNSMGISATRASDVFSYLGDATATGKHMCLIA